MWGSPAVPTMRQKVRARKFHMPTPVGHGEVAAELGVSLAAGAVAWRVARAALGLELVDLGLGQPAAP